MTIGMLARSWWSNFFAKNDRSYLIYEEGTIMGNLQIRHILLFIVFITLFALIIKGLLVILQIPLFAFISAAIVVLVLLAFFLFLTLFY